MVEGLRSSHSDQWQLFLGLRISKRENENRQERSKERLWFLWAKVAEAPSCPEGTTVFKIRVWGNIYVIARLRQMVVFVTKIKNEDM